MVCALLQKKLTNLMYINIDLQINIADMHRNLQIIPADMHINLQIIHARKPINLQIISDFLLNYPFFSEFL